MLWEISHIPTRVAVLVASEKELLSECDFPERENWVARRDRQLLVEALH